MRGGTCGSSMLAGSHLALSRLARRRGALSVISLRRGADLVALEDILTALALMDERTAKVIELRFFGG